jgi:hypothetical protein
MRRCTTRQADTSNAWAADTLNRRPEFSLWRVGE